MAITTPPFLPQRSLEELHVTSTLASIGHFEAETNTVERVPTPVSPADAPRHITEVKMHLCRDARPEITAEACGLGVFQGVFRNSNVANQKPERIPWRWSQELNLITASKGNRVFKLPKSPRRRKLWLDRINRGVKWNPLDYTFLCEPPPASQPSLRTVSGPGAPPSGTHPSTSSGPGQTAVPAPQEPPPEPPSATHALVFMIAGISSRWKQVICYHYTGNSFCGKEAASQVKVLIERCNSVGLQVVAVTSDMGSGNRAMWQHFDIYSGRYSRTTNKIPHPQQPGEQIVFLADVPHLINNLNGHLVRGQTIVLPADVVTANNLTCPTVSLDPIRQLVEFQKNLTFKLAPKLRPELLDPNHFEKMKVSAALQVLSHSTATALRFLVENHGWSQDFLTTAWFFEQVNRWFDLMSSRHPVLAIRKQNLSSYRNAIEFLTKFQQLFRQLKIGDGAYKPVQAGVVLSTKSVLDLQEMLIDKHSFSFVLTSRFTQDCLENLFSVVRQGNPIPTPLEFKMALKLITLSQYLKASKAGSYELDDASFYLTDLADVTALPTACSDVLPEEIELDMSDPENNSFVYYCGNIVRTVIKNNVTCDICAAAVQVTTTPAHSLLGLKNYVPNVLTCPSEAASTLFARCESVFRSLMHNLVGAQGILDSLSARMVAECQCVRLPECHDIKTKLIRRFCHARLQLFLREKSRKAAARATENREFGSKSMAAPRRRN
ncbi:hypothetical protein HPB47_015605 [Ixodes persulcatus]|uniref:Uncharacterized protein n=1 Tax=Ixodes persulcatus TaxID=34615 RepID=A0AC60QV09_IXOPE|nr:hypothetical protein HPB47_015605 [Ixodes persulcatus]